MIYGPKPDGTYIVEFKTAEDEALATSIPATETRHLDSGAGCNRSVLIRFWDKAESRIGITLPARTFAGSSDPEERQ